MKTTPSLAELEEEIQAVQDQLQALGPIHPGSTSLQYQVCGRPGCRCAHPTQPKRHGPYHKLSYVHRGKKACRFVRAECVDQINQRLATYKTFRRLTDRWVALSILRAQIEFFSTSQDKSHRQK